MEATSIKCPSCGTEINVSEILYHQVQDQLKKDFDKQLAEQEAAYKARQEEITVAKAQLAKEKESLNEEIETAVKAKVNIEKARLEKSITDKLKEENSDQLLTLQKELQEKSIQVRELNQTKAEIEKLKREKDELRETVVLEKEKEFSETLKVEKQKIQSLSDENLKELTQTKTLLERLKREKEELRDTVSLEKEKEFSEKLRSEKLKIQTLADESNALKIDELKKQLEDQKKLAEEMRRKAEQGSMQLQGEVQELAIEETLRAMFPFDIIAEVPKGVKGADAIHTVRNHIGTDCGTILYESKRTKAFSNDWINKLKVDAVTAKADVCIIITEAMPDGLDKIGQRDGVWICSFNDFKGLVLVLRESLLKINDAYSSQTNKGEKMQMLYDYLTSNEFKLQLGAIIEGFSDLQDGYVQEKRAMERIWKQREKQLERVLLNTNHFIGSIKGIAGSSIPGLKEIGTNDNLLDF
jgi:hypothetical protein